MQPLGVYISVPFCKAKCTFCNFASGAIGGASSEFSLDRIDGYVERVCEEMRAIRARAGHLGAELPESVDTIYFGGGTPSLLDSKQLDSIFQALKGPFQLEKDAEVTLECAPGQLSGQTLDAAMRHGVNRISFGVQSFVDAESRAVGRLHTTAECVAEVARVRAAGICEISLDLIAGLPGQTLESWETSLRGMVDAGVPHASVYMLEVDDESRLGKELIAGGPRYGARSVPSDGAMTEFYARACEVFEADGLKQYEISNFARAGHASKHNLKYWTRQPYVGFGLDAHSMLRTPQMSEPKDGTPGASEVRFSNADEMGEYLANRGGAMNFIDRDEAAEEAVFLGLRLNEGVTERLLREMEIEEMVRGGLMRRDGGRVMLTERGRMVSNEVFGELLRVAV